MAQPKLIDGKMFAVATKTDIKHLESAAGVLQCLAVMNVVATSEMHALLQKIIARAKAGPLFIGKEEPPAIVATTASIAKGTMSA